MIHPEPVGHGYYSLQMIAVTPQTVDRCSAGKQFQVVVGGGTAETYGLLEEELVGPLSIAAWTLAVAVDGIALSADDGYTAAVLVVDDDDFVVAVCDSVAGSAVDRKPSKDFLSASAELVGNCRQGSVAAERVGSIV